MSDFFERARSTGVIGITVIIFMLIGFGALFMAVFDDRLNGENATKLKETVREQAFELYGLEDEIEWASATLLEQKRVEAVSDELEKTNKVLEVLTRKEAELTTQIEEEKKAFQEVDEGQLSYREEYREFVREKAIGETYDELKLVGGKVLKNVKIREILPDKIRFTTEFGSTNVSWDEVPDEIRERFQIGDGELEAHKAKLLAIRAKRNQLAVEGKNERGVYLREMELKKTVDRLARLLQEKNNSKNEAKLRVAAFRAKAKQFRTKSYSTTFNQNTNSAVASKASKDADILDSKISIVNEQIRGLEREKEIAERELMILKRER